MHHCAAISTLALSILSLASASCNGTGQKATPDVIASMKNDEVLESTCSALIGMYAGHERRHTCVEVGDGKYDIMLHYVNKKDRYIGMAECKDGMTKQIDCERGGKTEYGNWEYKYA